MDTLSHDSPNNDILTLSEVAQYLKVAEKTVLRMIHRNEIPCAKIGNQWRFQKSLIDRWLHGQMQARPADGSLATLMEESPLYVRLSRLIRPEYVVLGIKPDTKEGVLAQLIGPLERQGLIHDRSLFLSGLIKRERMVSTAVGHGVAFPHLRNPGDNPITGPALIVGVCPDGTQFDSPDGEKTHLFFIPSTDNEVVHLRILSQLSRTVRRPGVVERLRSAPSAEAVTAVFLAAERDQEMETWRKGR